MTEDLYPDDLREELLNTLAALDQPHDEPPEPPYPLEGLARWADGLEQWAP